MLLYDMGDPIRGRRDPRPGHPQRPRQGRHPPDDARRSGASEVPLGQGEVDIPAFLRALKRVGYAGPLVIEREVGDQAGRLRDIAEGLALLRHCLDDA